MWTEPATMLRGILIATQFLTRIPIRWIKPDEEEIGRASAYFPFVGAIVGGAAALVFRGARKILPHSTSVLLMLIFTALITSAFHEDGLADSLDGLGGGWDREAALRIMKDSRIGTFGALGLIFLVLLKYDLLNHIDPKDLWRWLIFAHTASRWSALPLCIVLPYARAEGQGKLVAGRVRGSAATMGTITLVAASTLFFSPWLSLLALLVAAVVTLLTGLYYRHRLQGITGDCLGATNQLVEVAIYLLAVLVTRQT
jgi:adenosylcobinamide-GDP ribazoletransferase